MESYEDSCQRECRLLTPSVRLVDPNRSTMPLPDRPTSPTRCTAGPREALSADEVAQRYANNEAVRTAADWRALAAVLAERGGSLDGENISNMMFRVRCWGWPPVSAPCTR